MVDSFLSGYQDQSVGQGQSFKKMVLGKLDIHMQNNVMDLYLTYLYKT